MFKEAEIDEDGLGQWETVKIAIDIKLIEKLFLDLLGGMNAEHLQGKKEDVRKQRNHRKRVGKYAPEPTVKEDLAPEYKSHSKKPQSVREAKNLVS